MADNRHTGGIQQRMDTVMEDAQALLVATSSAPQDNVTRARQRLAHTLKRVRVACASINEKTITPAGAARRSLRGNPYESAGIAFGIGALIGFMLGCRHR